MRRVEVIIGMKRPAGAAFKAYPFIVIGRFGLGVRWRVPDSAAEVLPRVLMTAVLTETAWCDPRVSAELEFSCPDTAQTVPSQRCPKCPHETVRSTKSSRLV